MEAEKGVSLEDESCVIEKKHVEESVEHLNKEGENVSDCAVPPINGISEPIKKAEGLNSSGVVVKASAAVSTSKNLKSIKVQHKEFSNLNWFSYDYRSTYVGDLLIIIFWFICLLWSGNGNSE